MRQVILLIFIFAFFSCEKEDVSGVGEEKSLDIGISNEVFLNFQSLKKYTYEKNKNLKGAKSADIPDLEKRLDLEKAYLIETETGSSLRAAIRTFDGSHREYVSIVNQNGVFEFIVFFPETDDVSDFFLYNLQTGKKTSITIDENGQGLIEKSKTTKSTSNCYETVYQKCSSLSHSFEDGTAGSCRYWNSGGGTPPSVFSYAVQCPVEENPVDYQGGGQRPPGEVVYFPPDPGYGGEPNPGLDCAPGFDCGDIEDFEDAPLAEQLNDILGLSLSSDEYDYLVNNDLVTSTIIAFLDQNKSIEAKTEARMRINVEMATGNWQASPGTFLNRPALEYTHKYAPSSGGGMMYLLKNGLVFYNTNSKKAINPSDFETIAGTAPSADGYNYIHSYETKRWYETPLPPATYADADIDFLFKGFWKVTKTAARYATPIEDAIILIDGNDLDGIEANRNVAGLMILVSIVPGGKLLKPVGRIAKGSKSWQIASKIGNKTVIRTADKIFAELSTNKNTAFFWSGRKNGYGGVERALEIAQGEGGTTLEGLLSNKNIDLPEFDFFDNSITEIWNQASEAYVGFPKNRTVVNSNLLILNSHCHDEKQQI